MAVDVETEVVIERPLQQVAAYAADPGTALAWYARIESVDWLTPPPLGLGTRCVTAASRAVSPTAPRG